MTISSAEQALLEDVRAAARMTSKNECLLFEDGVYQLAQNKSRSMLTRLVALFDDNCPFEEVMYALVHAVETYPIRIYIEELLEWAARHAEASSGWYLILLRRVLNHREYGDLLLKYIESAYESTPAFFAFLRKKIPGRESEIQEVEDLCKPL